MDRVTLAALIVAVGSVLVGLAAQYPMEAIVRHAISLAVPVSIIAFPDTCEAAMRSTWRGRGHGGEGTPGVMLRIGGWVLLVVLVVVHHAVGTIRFPR